MIGKIFGKDFAKQGKSNKAFDVINHTILFVLMMLVLYPLFFIVISTNIYVQFVLHDLIAYYLSGIFLITEARHK